MPTFDEELLTAARLLVVRRSGQRGRLPTARVRRSISTTYYALFHFMLDEVGNKLVGTGNELRTRRRLLARTVSHSAMRLVFDKLKGARIDTSISEFIGSASLTELGTAPTFVRDLARAFSDAHTKRQDADYNLAEILSEADARILRLRVRRVIRNWCNARTGADRDAKHAICLLILLKGQLRADRQV